MSEKSQKRITSVDTGRGFAIILMILVHLFTQQIGRGLSDNFVPLVTSMHPVLLGTLTPLVIMGTWGSAFTFLSGMTLSAKIFQTDPKNNRAFIKVVLARIIGGFLIGYASFYLFLKGRQLSTPSAEKILSKDPRPPVLYLRPFVQDNDYEFSGFLQIFGVGGKTDEQKISDVMSDIGPFIAVGRPGEKFASLGAYRMYVDDAKWQETVGDLIKRSRLILLYPGLTKNFLWG